MTQFKMQIDYRIKLADLKDVVLYKVQDYDFEPKLLIFLLVFK